MRRAIVVAVSTALLMTLFGGVAAANSSIDGDATEADSVVRIDDDVEASHIWKRCRHLFGDEDLTAVAKERCRQLWKRWCEAHPDSRRCHRPDPPPPPPPCYDRLTDHRCIPIPCLSVDRLVDRRCIPNPCLIDQLADRLCIPDPCRIADLAADRVCVPDPCLRADGILPCVPDPCLRADGIITCVPDPTEVPKVRPIDRPVDRPIDVPPDRPSDKPPEVRPKGRTPDRTTDRPIDRVGNDFHLRALDADS